jgi:Mg2+/Co2+ transporter CorC
MFDYFQAHNTRAAIILGEYGEVHGMVTMKDVLKFIFGEISGRMEGQQYYREDDENSYIVPGDMRLTDFDNLTNFDIDDPVMTTIGGVAFRLFDCLPRKGQSLVHEGYEFTALELTGLRISKLMVRRIVVSDRTEAKDRKPEADTEQLPESVEKHRQDAEAGENDSLQAEFASHQDECHENKEKMKKVRKQEVKHGPVD